MIIRRKMPRVTPRVRMGNSGRKALLTGSNLARRMTISRLPDPSAMTSDIPTESGAPIASQESLFAPQLPRGQRGPISDITTSPTMPKDLQAIFDRHADQEMRRNTGMKSSGFIKDIVQRNKDAQAQETKGRFTTPRPQNVRYEPPSSPREPVALPTTEEAIDFPEQPNFQAPRTRSIFEYVNVSSPDKVQAHRADEPLQVADDAYEFEEDLPDALPGSYSIDDDQPTEAFDTTTLTQETDSPKAEAPQPTTIQRTPDMADPSIEGLSTSYADSIQRDTSAEISDWSVAEQDMQFADFEHSTSSQNAPEDGNAAGGDDSPRRQQSSTVQRQTDSTSSSNAPRTESATRPTSSTPLQGEQPSSSSQSAETPHGSSGNLIQRTPDLTSNNQPTIQRVLASDQSIQREVNAQIDAWQSDGAVFEGEPLTYASSGNEPIEPDAIVDSAPLATNTSVTGGDRAPIQRQPLADEPTVLDTTDKAIGTPSGDTTTKPPTTIQRSPASEAFTSESTPPRRDVTTPTQIQRDVQDQIEDWQTDAPDFEGESFVYEPSGQPSNGPVSATPAIQRHTDPEWTDTEWNGSDSTAMVADDGQRTISPSAAPQPPIVQRRAAPSSATPETSVQRSLSSDDVRPADPTVQRVSGPTAPDTVQRSVNDEIYNWQTQSPDFDAEPLTYWDMPPDPSTAPIGSDNVDTRSTAASGSTRTSVQRKPDSTSDTSGRPVVRRSTESMPPSFDGPSVGVTRVVRPSSQPAASDTAHSIQRDVADEISTWQQSAPSAPDFATTDPEWYPVSAGPESTSLGDTVQRTPSPRQLSATSPSAPTPDSFEPSFGDTMEGNFDDQSEQMPLAQALLEAGFFESAPAAPDSTPPIQRKPAQGGNSAREKDLLSLMNMDPDTPINNEGPTVTVGVDAAAVQRAMDGNVVQREEVDTSGVGEDTSGDDNSGKDAADSGKSQDQQVEEMAEKVYSILRRRFRVEIERDRGL